MQILLTYSLIFCVLLFLLALLAADYLILGCAFHLPDFLHGQARTVIILQDTIHKELYRFCPHVATMHAHISMEAHKCTKTHTISVHSELAFSRICLRAALQTQEELAAPPLSPCRDHARTHKHTCADTHTHTHTQSQYTELLLNCIPLRAALQTQMELHRIRIALLARSNGEAGSDLGTFRVSAQGWDGCALCCLGMFDVRQILLTHAWVGLMTACE